MDLFIFAERVGMDFDGAAQGRHLRRKVSSPEAWIWNTVLECFNQCFAVLDKLFKTFRNRDVCAYTRACACACVCGGEGGGRN